MAMTTQVYRALITADAGGAVKEYRKYEGQVDKSTTAAAKQLGKTEAAMKRVKVAAAAIGATAAIYIGKYSVDAAKNLTEAINAVNVMYGESSEAVLKLSEDAAHGVGLSKRAFDEAAVSVGGFVNQIAEIQGVGAAGVLDDLITRAADFGSVFNIDVDEALQRFRSGLAGETEPLRRFGINLLQSEVSAYALAEGIVEVGEKMTEEQKVMARYELLMQKTDQMAGDFAATSGELANAQRILKAGAEDLAAEFGEALVPAAQGAITALTGLMELMQNWKIPEAMKGISEFIFGDQTAVAASADKFGKHLTDGFARGMSGSEMLRRMQPLRDAAEEAQGMIDTIDDAVFGDWLPGAHLADTWVPAIQGLAVDSQESAEQVVFSLMAMGRAAEEGSEQARIALIGAGFSFMDTGESAMDMARRMSEAIGMYEQNSSAARHANRANRESIEPLSESTKDLAFTTDLATQSSRDVYQAFLDQAEATDDAARAAEEAAQEMEDLFNLVDGRIRGMFDYETAMHEMALAAISFEQAQFEANQVVDDAETPINELEVAMRELWLQEKDLAEQAYDTALAYGVEQGAIEGSTEWAILMRDALIDQAAAIPELRDEIALMIEALDAIPRDTFANIHLTTFGAKVLANDLVRSGGGSGQVADPVPPPSSTGFSAFGQVAGATGGVVTRPTFALIGEAGPEAVIPLNRTPGSSPLGSMGGNSGPFYTINVNAGMGTDGATVGKQVVKVIKQYERTNGTRWRS